MRKIPIMVTTDRAAGLILVLFALLVIWESRLLPLGDLRHPGPAFIPILLALLLLLCGAFLVLIGGARLLSSIRWTEWRHAVAIAAASSCTVLAIERLGYRLTMSLILGFVYHLVEKRGWFLSIAISLSLAFGSFFLFHSVLRVPLPLGPFGF
jgi:putative tricarboxylic transport membrane protein